jgi:hypothetical protein
MLLFYPRLLTNWINTFAKSIFEVHFISEGRRQGRSRFAARCRAALTARSRIESLLRLGDSYRLGEQRHLVDFSKRYQAKRVIAQAFHGTHC